MDTRTSPVEPLANAPRARGCSCFKIRRLARTVSRLYDQHLAESGLKTTQFSLLRNISGTALPLSQLAERAGLERTTLTRNLRPLIEAGFVSLAAGRDQRERIVSLTPAGSAAIDSAKRAWRVAQSSLEATLGAPFLARLHAEIDDAQTRIQSLLSNGELHDQH